MTLFPILRRPRIVPPCAALLAAIAVALLPRLAIAQEKAPPVTPAQTEKTEDKRRQTEAQTQTPPSTPGTPPTETKKQEPSTGSPPAGNNPQPSARQGTPSPADAATPNNVPPQTKLPEITARIYTANPITGEYEAEGVSIAGNGVTITADRASGNINTEVILTGNARIVTATTTAYADTIHFYPQTRRYRLDNPRSVLTPDVLQNRVYDNVFVTSRDLFGNRQGTTFADNTTETTCIEPFHHYELRSRDAYLLPGQRLVLHQTSVILFGVKLITIPYIVIPLDKKPPKRRERPSYFPEFGQNVQEGYYGRFPYEFPIGQDAASYVQVSATQKLGERLRFEQEYLAGKQASQFDTSGYGYGGGFSGSGSLSSDPGGAINSAYGYGNIGPRLPQLGTGLGPASGGLFTIQGYTSSGFNRNFTTSLRHQQGFGSNNRFGFSTELSKQSYLVSSGQTTQNTRFDLAHDDSVHGVNLLGSINIQTNDSTNYSTNQISGSLRNSFQFASQGSNRNSLSYQIDVSRLLNTQTTLATDTTAASEAINRTARADTQFQFQHTAREYQFMLSANKSTPIGFQSAGTSIGTLEKLPEFQFTADTINFKGGLLRQLPTTFTADLGKFNEPASKTFTERLLLGFNIPQITVMRGRTELVTGGGFEQRLYGDGAAQYETRNNTRLRQHILGRSGFDINYLYDQPEGGTPFTFDQYSHSHYLTGESGYLDDKHFQATLRTGYDLSGRTSGRPFQTLTARLMWQPRDALRFDSLTSYDPNTGKFLALTNQMRLRGANDLAFDLVSRIDPQQPGIRRKFSQINMQFDVPFARGWRFAGLLRFNGGTGLFESRAAELIHEWDCLEASVSYSENPNSFYSDRQIYFALRVKALPSTRRFNRGPAGQALGVGVGDIY